MGLIELVFVIGCVIVLCSSVNGGNLRKRRQSDIIFPDEFDHIANRGGFGGGFGNGNPFLNGFQNQLPQQGRQQSRFPQQPTGGGFFSGRVPFPTPIQPGPPATIDSFPQESAVVVPDTMLTTPSPSFLTCYNSCPTTSEYNPICGTNRQLYFNQQKFECAQRCGAQVQVWRRGSCEGLFPMMRG